MHNVQYIISILYFLIYIYICNGFPYISKWTWKNSCVHYIHQLQQEDQVDQVDQKTNQERPALLLLHGFGASSYHWRDNIDTLSQNYDVYALDLVGSW